MLSEYVGGPCSQLGIVVKSIGLYVDVVRHQYILLTYEKTKPERLQKLASSRRLPNKRLHISGGRYVH